MTNDEIVAFYESKDRFWTSGVDDQNSSLEFIQGLDENFTVIIDQETGDVMCGLSRKDGLWLLKYLMELYQEELLGENHSG